MKPRADREPDPWRLAATFVDPGISEQLDNPNNEIIFGRRGTGKTHVLRVVHELLSSSDDSLVVYIDLRTLGSSSVFEDAQRPLHVRATSLIKDVFEPLHSALLDRATEPERADIDFTPLNALADAMTRSILSNERQELEIAEDESARDSFTATIKASPPFVELGGTGTTEARATARQRREGNPLDNVLFGQLSRALADSLRATAVGRLYLLLDEWTAIPEDLQPYLAEFLRRCLFVVPSVTVKIAALEYRSSFCRPLSRNNVIGFELGADIASNLELDDYFVYDRNSSQTEDVFAAMLFRHLAVEIAERRSEADAPSGSEVTAPDYLEDVYEISDHDRLVEVLFVSRRPYRELVRAGEGVVRDFIGIFATAFDDAIRRKLRAIDLNAVRGAARMWYATDKEANLGHEHRMALTTISDEVIARGRRRTFMFDRRNEPNETLLSLVDMRVLHLIQRNILDPSNPTRRYNIYSLDYGLYVDLLDTKYELKSEFGGRKASPDLVPLEGRGYVRGVVLKPEVLAKALAMASHAT